MNKPSRSIGRELTRMGLPNDDRARGYAMDPQQEAGLILHGLRRTSEMLSGWPVVEKPDEAGGVYVMFMGQLYRAPVEAERLASVVTAIAHRCEDH